MNFVRTAMYRVRFAITCSNSLLSEWVKTLISRWLKRRKFVKFSKSDKRELQLPHLDQSRTSLVVKTVRDR
jgi:hypothetical protein